jgi:hypothetical protein
VTAGYWIAAVYSDALGLHSRLRLMADQVDMVGRDGVVHPLLMAAIGGAFPTPVVSGKIEVDLDQKRLIYFTDLTADAEMQFPVGAYEGAKWQHYIRQNGSYGLTFDLGSFIVGDAAPTMPAGAGVYALFEGTVMQISPIPVAEMRRLSYGSTNLSSTRRFLINPPIEGRTIWDIDFHGPLTITGPYTGSITPLGATLDADWVFYGPGGSTSGNGATRTDATAGTDTTFGGFIVAGAGQPASGVTTTDGNRKRQTNGGAGGAASGGDTNTPGQAGGNGVLSGVTNVTAQGGKGGGDLGPSVGSRTCGTSNGNTAAITGPTPGQGASGVTAASNQQNAATGGGGEGGRVQWTSSASGAHVLTNGTPYAIQVGGSGNAGTATGNVGVGPGGSDVLQPTQGAKGGSGRVVIS